MTKSIFLRLTLASTALLALSACGSNDKEGTITGENGEKIEYKVDESGDGDANVEIKTKDGSLTMTSGEDTEGGAMPGGLKAYPGAKIVNRMNMASSSDKGSDGSLVVTLETTDSSEMVMAFYKDQLKSQGVTVQSEMSTPDFIMLAGQAKSGEAVQVMASKADDKLSIVLSASKAN